MSDSLNIAGINVKYENLVRDEKDPNIRYLLALEWIREVRFCVSTQQKLNNPAEDSNGRDAD